MTKLGKKSEILVGFVFQKIQFVFCAINIRRSVDQITINNTYVRYIKKNCIFLYAFHISRVIRSWTFVIDGQWIAVIYEILVYMYKCYIRE